MKINIPNILSLTRILLTPLFVIFMLNELLFYALLTFIIAGVSDVFDGLVARYCNQRTILGAYLDPIADKLLLTAAFGSLAVLQFIPGWVAVLVICRDVLIVIGVLVFGVTNIQFDLKPSFVSKCTTAIQLSTVLLILLNPDFSFFPAVKQTLYWLTAGFTIFSGLHYIYIGLNIFQEGSGNGS